jgi:hypothetical protein
MVLLLEKKYEVLPQLGVTASICDLRTITIANAETRLIFKPWSMVLDGPIRRLVDRSQTVWEGTIPNIIGIQSDYQRERQSRTAAGLLFIDAADAFPSMSHAY